MCNQSKALECCKHPAVPVKPEPLPTRAVNIVECSVATDSVVATATVRIDATMRRIVVDWGDGTVNTLRNRPGTEAAAGQQLPPGTYKFSHAYEAPEHRNAFETFVIIRVEDVSGGADVCARTISHTTIRGDALSYLSHVSWGCDFGSRGRERIRYHSHVDGELIKTWKWKPPIVNPYFSFCVGREPSQPRAHRSRYPVKVVLGLTEIDPIFDDYLSNWSNFLYIRRWPNFVHCF